MNNRNDYNIYYLFIVLFCFFILLFLTAGSGYTLPDAGTFRAIDLPSAMYLHSP